MSNVGLIKYATLSGLIQQAKRLSGTSDSVTPQAALTLLQGVTPGESDGETYILVTPDGTEIPAVLVEEETVFTATANDIRLGLTAVTDKGVVTGEKVIPSYHTREGVRIITAGSSVTIPNQDTTVDDYDYTKLQSIICSFNSSLIDSVSTHKVSIGDHVYNTQSVDSIASITKNHDKKRIELGITNDSDKPWVVRFFYYKEII